MNAATPSAAAKPAGTLARALPTLLVAGLVALGLAHGPIGQLANYHDFADHTVLFGIPNACDVLSNLAFAAVALWGLARFPRSAAAAGYGAAGYRLFLVSLLLTAFGSTWYHLAPDNARLVWDRIPIALACAGLLAGVRGEALRRDSTRATVLLGAFALASVGWWYMTELQGNGDLRPYLLLQSAPLFLLPLWQWLGQAPKRARRAVAAALICYAIAKFFELQDHQVATIAAPLTGHTLKHLVAALAAAILVGGLMSRPNKDTNADTTADTTGVTNHPHNKSGRANPTTADRESPMFKAFLRAVLKVLFRVEVKGDAQTFVNPRTLVVANHESFLDGLLLGLMMPVDATYVVHSQIAARPLFRFLLRFVPHLAVDSTSPLAMKQIVKLVETGRPVVIFPEGRITKTGSLMKVYDGAAFVAAKTGATVVPVRIDGAAQSYFGRLAGVYPRKAFPKVTISILPRREIPMPDLPSAKLRRRRAGELLRQILLDMLVATRPTRTIFGAFLDAKDTFGKHYKLVEDVRLVEESYGSLLKMSLGLQRVLSRHTAQGEVVGVLTPNAAPTLGLVLALSAGGRVPALLNYTAGPDGLQAACTAAKITTIVTSRAFLDKARLGPLVEGLSGITVLYLEDFRAQVGIADKAWVLWHLLFPRAAEVAQRPDDAAVVLFTSGSEGKPKGVVHSHASVLSNVAQVRAVADFTPLDKFMMALPLFHSFGLTCGVLLPLVSGCKVFLYPSPLHYRIIPEIVYDRDCTVLFGTSTFLGNYGKHAHPYDFGRLRYVVAGAEKLSEEVRRTWIEKFGIRILEGYGVTECAPVVAVNVPMACRIGSVGQLLPGMQFELETVPGIEEADGQVGALHVKGPNVMKGYFLFDQPGVIQPPKSIGDGWYSTGDIVALDADGFLHIRGRMKRFAKIAGEMVSLEVVEKIAAAAAPGFAHAASTRPDAGKGEALVLFTTARELARDALLAAARSVGAPELAVPRTIRQIDAIPLLGTGKTDYVKLKQLAEAA